MKSSCALTLALLWSAWSSSAVHAQQQQPQPQPEAQPQAQPVEPPTWPEPEPEITPPPKKSSIELSKGANEGVGVAATKPLPIAGPFSQGRVGIHVALGTSFFGRHTYLMLGAGVGVHVIDGLELSLDGQVWLFDDPFTSTITPALTYTFFFVPVFTPYVGTFFRHYIVGDNIDDFDSIGFRLGGYIAPYRSRVRFGAGFTYERTLDCNDQIWSCDDFYPELSFAIWF